MSINKINSNKNQSFKSITAASTQLLRCLNTNPALGATTVDICSMSAPRTLVDGVERGLDAGVETGIRESSGTVNHALIGAYGIGASVLLSQGINKAFNIRADKVFANLEGIDTIGSIWQDLVKTNEKASPNQLRKLLFERVLTKLKCNAHTNGRLKKIGIDKKAINLFMENISEYIEKKPESYKIPQKLYEKLKTALISSTATETDFVLKNAKYSTKSDLDTLLKSTFSLGKMFSEQKALKAFKESAEYSTNKFVKLLKNTKLKSSIAGVAAAMLIGASVQPLNVWLTKVRTGKEGFVGVEGEKPDNSLKFKVKKTAAAAGFLAFSYATIVDNVFKTPFKKQVGQLLNRLQFNGLIPSIAQFKAVYGFTVASRFLASRGNDELREAETKDVLGYANWLILGNFVQKSVASMSKHNLTNYDPKIHGNNIIKRIFSPSVKVKTHDEILFEELKKQNLTRNMLSRVDGSMLTSKELIKKFGDKLPNLKARIRGKNIAQVSGYLYSALVLGILIPKLNIAITNHLQNKKKNQQDNNVINSDEKFKIIYDK